MLGLFHLVVAVELAVGEERAPRGELVVRHVPDHGIRSRARAEDGVETSGDVGEEVGEPALLIALGGRVGDFAAGSSGSVR